MKPGCRVFVSSGAFGQQRLGGVLCAARAWGVSNLELSGGLRWAPGIEHLLKGASGFEFLIHNYFPPPVLPFVLNLASDNPSTLRKSLAQCKVAIDLCVDLKSPYFSVHAGFAANVKPEHLGSRIPAEHRVDKWKSAAIFEKSIRSLIDYASPQGVTLLVENNVVTTSNLINGYNDMLLLATSEELIDFAKRMNSNHFGLLIDVGHVNVTSRTLEVDRLRFLEDVVPWTRGIHLSDNDGLTDSNLPFTRSAWFVGSLKSCFPDFVVIEAYGISSKELQGCYEAIGAAYE
jgi:sugar phosphate isomerase/epimerase